MVSGLGVGGGGGGGQVKLYTHLLRFVKNEKYGNIKEKWQAKYNCQRMKIYV